MENESILPLISCICITYNRPEMLLRSILSFQKQNYPNKELIISYPQKDQQTNNLIEEILAQITMPIISIKRIEEESIGKARNIAIEKCNGEYVCMWDDDDIYYPTRITDQYTAMKEGGKFEACILSRILLYEATAQKTFLSYPSYWVCTLLCKKDHLLNHPCEERDDFEYDSILDFLKSENTLYYFDSSPSLYTFIFHGTNHMQYTTFLFLINRSTELPNEVSKNIAAFLGTSQAIPFKS